MQGHRADSSRGPQARLPVIAPRNDAGLSPGSSTTSTGESDFQTGSRRSRLPPRSRSGCWTCRTRKVKCDEQRPSCGQCLRLGHNCDYNPRLSFRDDTPRVVERMQEISTVVGSSVWDLDASGSTSSQGRSAEDLLPPFAALTTDEDRERKAELQNPGTYHVVANPKSFVSLPEYRDENAINPSSVAGSTISAFDPNDEGASYARSLAYSEDPNVVILKSFNETPRRLPTLQSNKSINPDSPSSSQASVSHTPISFVQSNVRISGDLSTSMLDIAREGGRDAQFLQHYRAAISPHIMQIPRFDRDEDLFETQARTYPPLFHAMMALAALSIANQNGAHSADALEHYQSVIPALKTTVQSSRDSYSDGALFTHFILLLYEIADAGHRESNMWQHHSDQLLRITTLRRQTYGNEPYDFIVWTTCAIDVYALLSASGTGHFVEALVEQNMVPAPERCLPPASPGQFPFIYPEERTFSPALLKLNQQVTLLALRVGQLARNLRIEAAQRQYGDAGQTVSELMFLMNRRVRIQDLHREMEQSGDTWRSQNPDYWTWLMENRPPRVFAWTTQSYMLFRACLIYSHTSMYPNQSLDPTPDTDTQIRVCAAETIQVARLIVSQERYEQQFIVFPLFMAGLATKDPVEKEVALSLIRAVERHSYGRTTERARELLERIYQKQEAAILATGDPSAALSVDWVEEMELSGQRLILYGL